VAVRACVCVWVRIPNKLIVVRNQVETDPSTDWAAEIQMKYPVRSGNWLITKHNQPAHGIS